MKAIITLIIAGAAIWYFWLGGLDRKISSDQIEQYKLAKQSGDRASACVQAKLVAQSYLTAGNEDKYLTWKRVETEDCK